MDAGSGPEHLPGGHQAALVDAGRGPEHLPGGHQAALVDAGSGPEHLPGGHQAALVDAGRGPEHLPGGQQAALVDAGRRPEHPPGGQLVGLADAGIRPEHLPGGQQHAERAGGGGGLLGPLALPAGGLEPLVLRPEGLPPAPEGDPVVYGPGGHHGGAERQQGHPPTQAQQAVHQPGSGQVLRHSSDPQGLQAVMRTLEGVGGARNPWWSDRVPSKRWPTWR